MFLLSDIITVGISDMKIVRNPKSVITYALGSCVGIALYDNILHLGGILHIMLPNIKLGLDDNIFKYASTGIPEMIRKMEIFGSNKKTMVAKIAGGAKMFDLSLNSSMGSIGDRNILAVREILVKEHIRIASEDVGLNYARTMLLDTLTGNVTIKAFGHETIIL